MPQFELYPTIIGVFIQINVDVFYAPPQGPIVDLEMGAFNAKLMIFQTSEHTYRMFISGGLRNEALLEPLLDGCSTENWEMRKGEEDDLVWNISDQFVFEYRVRFQDVGAVEKFSHLVSLWERSGNRALGILADVTAKRALKVHVINLAMRQWDDEENAFAEIDMLTSSFALFYGILDGIV